MKQNHKRWDNEPKRFKYKIQNTKYKIQKYKIQNTKYKIQNTKIQKYKIQNTNYKIQTLTHADDGKTDAEAQKVASSWFPAFTITLRKHVYVGKQFVFGESLYEK